MPRTCPRVVFATLLVLASVVLVRPVIVGADADANVVAIQPARLVPKDPPDLLGHRVAADSWAWIQP